MTKAKKIILLLICFLTLVFSLLTAVVSFAYFSKKEIYDGYFSGEVELLFDRLNAQGIAAYQAHLDEIYTDGSKEVTADATADWGTEAYPYVISDVRHLYNLSELQRLGFFDKKFISQNTETSFSNIPYFLVCTPEYTPALIDGTDFKGITSIGTDEFPFIGSVCGVKSETQKITVGEKLCDTSAISNIIVSGNPANADVGLFGYVGYLGTEKTTEAFTGQISTLSNLVLTDVQVTVQSSLWDAVTAFLEDIAINTTGGHRYSFTELYNTTDYDKVPHENHHVGILAGHAAYAKIEYISVYYSADNKVAIDLKDETVVEGTEANYLSATGILGYIYNINPTFTNSADGSHTITPGSGDSVGDLSYGTVGGGGLISGMKSGYVLAAEMYNNYRWEKGANGSTTEDEDGTIYLKDAVDENGNTLCVEWIRDRLLWGTEATGRYYFYDGVFTFALSSQQDVIEPTWNNGTADEFSIGSTDPSGWKANTEKGNKASVAYVKEIKTLEELAENVGKDIFILAKNSDGSVFLMTLNTVSKSNFNLLKPSTWGDNNYTTSGMLKSFASQEMVSSLITSIQGNNPETPELYPGMIEELGNGTLKVINLGSTEDLTTLRDQYKIRVGNGGDTVWNTFQFSTNTGSSTNNLGMILRDTFLGTFYNIYCGHDYSKFSAHSEKATLTYSDNNADPYFYLQYSITYESSDYSRYVSYDSTNSRFTSANNNSNSKLYLYSIVGTCDMDFGRITFDPIDNPSDDTDCYTFSADEMVLFATSEHSNDTNGNIATTATTYEVKSLETLGWNNGSGETVSSADLQKKFRMTKGITFGASFNLFNGTLGSDGIITALVGADGTEANIPQSCIAFRINKEAKDIKICVIVSVAVSEYYPGEMGENGELYPLDAYTRYFNLWKMEAAGESIVQVFNATGDDLLDRFEVPRSHPYEPGTTAASSSSEYITVKYGSNDYRCYLNGDRVLVAYEFTVDSTSTTGTGVGVYCLGMSGIDSSGNTISDVPMEIVYFSAEGVASAGRDGASGSQIGTIDFVYDYDNAIVTVTKSSDIGSDGSEDYHNYYPSYCLLYFDISREYSVNTEEVIIRRYVYVGTGTPSSDANHNTTPSKSIIYLDPSGIHYACIVQYSRYADNVNAT